VHTEYPLPRTDSLLSAEKCAKESKQDGPNICWKNIGHSCIVRATIHGTKKLRTNAPPTITIPLFQTFFSKLKDASTCMLSAHLQIELLLATYHPINSTKDRHSLKKYPNLVSLITNEVAKSVEADAIVQKQFNGSATAAAAWIKGAAFQQTMEFLLNPVLSDQTFFANYKKSRSARSCRQKKLFHFKEKKKKNRLNRQQRL